MKRCMLPILICLLLTLAACGGRQTAAPEESPDLTAQQEETAALESEVAELEEQLRQLAEEQEHEARLTAYLDGMTLEQKVGQLFFVRCPDSAVTEKIAGCHLGGVLLFTKDFKDGGGNWLSRDAVVEKLESYQAAADLPLFIASDEEGGTVTRASRNPNLFDSKSPSPQSLYRSGGLDAVTQDIYDKSVILTALGINVNFAPVCDVSTDPQDYIYSRTLGEDAATTAEYIRRAVVTMGEAGMGSVLKHFAGYGDNADTHTGVAVDERAYEQFEQSDFVPFRAGIEAEAKIQPFVMVSHNIVICMDPELPASLSPAVHRILRDELDFDGVILTDDLAMSAVRAYAEDGSAAVMALRAGNDMIVTTDFETQIQQVMAAVADGSLDESVIDEACLRVLRAKEARFDMPWETEENS